MSADTLTLSLPADSLAVSQYANLPFTGFFQLGGQTYGCAPDGLYRIGGDDDAGEAIRPVIEGPRIDAGTDAFKRLRGASVVGRGVEGLTLSTRTGDGDWREALATGHGRFACGRDNVGREVQWRIEGDGADFEITAVALEILNLGRQARG
uniref:Uncharacterized protein n=1 Tax=Desulfovibrio sp. U5L TaxID=596152 RepID=I2Q1D2_9BACT